MWTATATELCARVVVNAAGLHALDVARLFAQPGLELAAAALRERQLLRLPRQKPVHPSRLSGAGGRRARHPCDARPRWPHALRAERRVAARRHASGGSRLRRRSAPRGGVLCGDQERTGPRFPTGASSLHIPACGRRSAARANRPRTSRFTRKRRRARRASFSSSGSSRRGSPRRLAIAAHVAALLERAPLRASEAVDERGRDVQRRPAEQLALQLEARAVSRRSGSANHT